MSYAAAPVPVRLPIWRARFVLFAFVSAFAVLLGRSLWLQAVQTGFLQERGEARYSRVLEVPATRGRILDRRGDALAISTPVKSIWAIPEDLKATAAQLRQLGQLLGVEPRELERRLTGTSRDFVYLKRQIPPETAARVAELGIPGLYQQREFRRYYPGGETMAHVVGFTGVDDIGQEGIELAFQASLAGASGSRRVIKDRLGHVVEDIEAIRAAQDGKDLRLALDSKLQSLAFTALKHAVETHKAKGGALVALDTRTGEVLALANVPSYNPNNRARLTGAQLRNRVITDLFEPGSTLKPFTVALALDLGQVTPETVIQTAPGRLTIARHTIHDAHAGGAMSVAQVIQKSSNVGAAKIALSLPREEMRENFRRVGFGAPPQLGFPGEAAGKVREARTWRPIEQATMAYGHGISVSLIQLARAYTAFARDGELLPLSLVRTDMPVAGRQVLSAETARAMRAMLEAATQPGGTAPRARVMGWRVAGKTGTAHKLENGGYASHKYIASFVGFAPASDPRLVIAVMIDEPSAGQYYGGAVAAPVFAQVMQGALRLMNVPHDAPLTPIELPGEGEEAREST
ncbi:MAG: cell division protein [Betaproteobacteria bacterium RIFCSPLOWO2_12_FULL_67_28]|nr:MAG: cell division protein [Betaproteobacteria bacterium RIFCSPLOWO2_02_FULL_68_150]OGA67514.1 MAG: cell division protein [Betaproteobacteria bacterium RIFCSPLOWO2_12_FULL_67_28]